MPLKKKKKKKKKERKREMLDIPILFFQNLVPTWCVTILWDCGTLSKMINLMGLWYIMLKLNSEKKYLDV